MPSKSEAYIHVKARLWNSTLVADYPRVDLVKIVSSAQISIPEIYNIQQTTRDDKTTVNHGPEIETFSDLFTGTHFSHLFYLYHHLQVSTYAYPDLHEQPGDGSIPIWIIIVSIVCGILLLALFTYCLWRLGFFKRRRPDPTLSGNLEKNSESKSLLHR